MKSGNKVKFEYLGKLKEDDGIAEITYWQSLDSDAISSAAWEMVQEYHLEQGKTLDELRLQRTVEHLQRKSY